MAFIQYCQDSDEKLPAQTLPAANLGNGWAGQIYSYVKATGVYDCPDDSTAGNAALTPPSYPVSYAYNLNLARTDQPALPTGNIAQLHAPASTILLLEVAGLTAQITDSGEAGAPNSPVTEGFDIYKNSNPTYTTAGAFATGLMGGRTAGNGGFNGTQAQTASPGSGVTGRHTDGSNFLLCDGHVKWLRGSAVSTGGLNLPTPQETDPQTPSKCAGTGVSTYTATMSPI